jgi:hypothetical protein
LTLQFYFQLRRQILLFWHFNFFRRKSFLGRVDYNDFLYTSSASILFIYFQLIILYPLLIILYRWIMFSDTRLIFVSPRLIFIHFRLTLIYYKVVSIYIWLVFVYLWQIIISLWLIKFITLLRVLTRWIVCFSRRRVHSFGREQVFAVERILFIINATFFDTMFLIFRSFFPPSINWWGYLVLLREDCRLRGVVWVKNGGMKGWWWSDVPLLKGRGIALLWIKLVRDEERIIFLKRVVMNSWLLYEHRYQYRINRILLIYSSQIT